MRCLAFGNANAQIVKSQKERFSIIEIKLKDKALEDTIYSYIKKQSENDSLFNKIGYVFISFNNLHNLNRKIKYSCYFNKRFNAFDDDDIDFPMFYTYIDNRIVVIKGEDISSTIDYNITKRSKRKFRRKIEIFLPKARKIRFDGGKLQDFREPNIVMIDGGKIFFKLEDGTSYIEDAKY